MAKVRIGAIDKSLIDKTKQYKKLTGISTVELIEDLLTDFFNETVLSNNFIELEEPYYFVDRSEFTDLKRTFKASLENPIETVEKKPDFIYVVNEIPNNLDSFSKEHNSFCFNNNPNRHKGVYIYHKFLKLSDNPEEIDILDKIYLFDYNEADKTLIIEETDVNELEFKIDLATHKEVYDSIINEATNYKDWIYESNLSEDGSERLYKDIESDVFLNYAYVMGSYNIIEPYEDFIAMKNYLIKTGKYNPEFKGRTSIIRNKKLIKPTDLKEMVNNGKL